MAMFVMPKSTARNKDNPKYNRNGTSKVDNEQAAPASSPPVVLEAVGVVDGDITVGTSREDCDVLSKLLALLLRFRSNFRAFSFS